MADLGTTLHERIEMLERKVFGKALHDPEPEENEETNSSQPRHEAPENAVDENVTIVK